MNMWKIGIGVVALIALVAATVGFVGAQTDEDGNGPLGNFVARLAENLGITEGELEAAIDQTQLDMVDEALADGRITEEQAAQARERIESGEPFFGPLLRNKHRMHDGEGHQMRHGGGGFLIGANVAEFIGVTPEELRDAIQGGQSVVQVAEANGISEEALTAHLLDQIATKVAEKVADGTIDQAKADEILANAAEKIADHITRVGPFEKPEGFGALREGGFPHGGFGEFREGWFPGGFGRFHGDFQKDGSTDVTEAVSPTF